MIRLLPILASAVALAGQGAAETPTPLTMWTDLEVLQRTAEHYYHGHRNLESDETPTKEEQGMLCGLVVQLFDAAAPLNENRDCSCNFWAQSIECNYKSVSCRDKVLPSLNIVFDLGFRSTTVHICQEFMEEEFEKVCIEADLKDMKYDVCKEATMGEGLFGVKDCSCTVCPDGMALDVDCSEKHPQASTNGCQPVFFQDTCLDFAPTNSTEGGNAAGAGPPDVLDIPAPTSDPIQDEGVDTPELAPPEMQQEIPAEVPPTPVQADPLDGDEDSITSQGRFFFNDEGEQVAVTAQALASNWAMGDPNADFYTTTKRIQRYAMAAFFFSTTAHGDWMNSNDWLSYTVDECDWHTESLDPPCVGGQLESLDLTDNALSGPLNPEIGYLRSLLYLYLPYNFLSGDIPSTIGMLTNLIDFDMHAANLNGTIPTEIGLLTNLEALSLNTNWLSGTIPSELALLTNVYAFELDHNNLSGTVPQELCNLISQGKLLVVDCDGGDVVCTCNSGCECAGAW